MQFTSCRSSSSLGSRAWCRSLRTRLRAACRLSVRAACLTRSWRNVAHGLPLPPQLQGRTGVPTQPQQVGGEHVGRSPGAMVYGGSARHAHDGRDPGHWAKLHGTIAIGSSHRAGRQSHHHARNAAIRCIGSIIRNVNVKRPNARLRVAGDYRGRCLRVPARASVAPTTAIADRHRILAVRS